MNTKFSIKEVFIVILIISIIVCLDLSIYSIRILFQEGAPVKTAKALYDINILGKQYSEINENKYLLGNSRKDIPISDKENFCKHYESFCNDKGLKYKDRLGAILIIEKNNKKACALLTSFTRHFTVINLDCNG